MEGTEITTRQNTAGRNGTQEADQMLLNASKPLHRFVQREPKSLGIVIAICGCAEILMGFHLASETLTTSCTIYIPFWQGLLFLVCGNLSIYTEVHPSKKLVTVCLAMYVVSLFGIVVSVVYRIYCCSLYNRRWFGRYWAERYGATIFEQLLCVEVLLLTCSLCVSMLLIFLCVVARLALRSTRTQIIVQQVPPPQNDTASD